MLSTTPYRVSFMSLLRDSPEESEFLQSLIFHVPCEIPEHPDDHWYFMAKGLDKSGADPVATDSPPKLAAARRMLRRKHDVEYEPPMLCGDDRCVNPAHGTSLVAHARCKAGHKLTDNTSTFIQRGKPVLVCTTCHREKSRRNMAAMRARKSAD